MLDTVGHGTVDTAFALGVRVRRINTIAVYAALDAHGSRGLQPVGGAAAGIAELEIVAALLAAGTLTLPVDSTHPLDDVRSA